MARVSVFGLGYVGTVSAAALAAAGHEVIGVDPNPIKVDAINAGMSPVIEKGLDELLAEVVGDGRLRAIGDAAEAVRETSISVICVGTPSRGNGSLDLSHVRNVAGQIGDALATTTDDHVIVVRSTMLPGSTDEAVAAVVEARSGKRRSEGFGICFNPEFLREGSSLADYRKPPFTLIGADDDRSALAAASLYADVDAELLVTPIRVAEMVKYTSNAFHALKVAFANEIGNICAAQNVDSHRVMEVFSRDTKLNISKAYLTPGFAFGGSCLPKDLRALTYHSRRLDVESPVLESIMSSNRLQIEKAFRLVEATGTKKVGVLGMSFKPGTDDLRESPVVELIERLIGKGYDVRIHDRNVSLAGLQGANRDFIETEIPHISTLMCRDVVDVLDHAEVLVLAHNDPDLVAAAKSVVDSTHVVDLVRMSDEADPRDRYAGISW